MESQRVKVTIEGGVADVRLSRPGKLNALDQAMFEALIDTGKALARDKRVRSVVLSGEGRGFCAGLDFASFMAMAGSDRPTRQLMDRADFGRGNFAQQAAFVWQEVPAPVIAAIHGVAFGGGLQIALGADIRFVRPDAQLSVMEIKWGLIPDMSGTQTLRRLLRLDVVKELTFTGRIVSGADAVQLGLATHVSDDPHADAMALAREIAGKSPDAIRAGKRLLNESGLSTVEEGLRMEESLQRSLIGSPNQLEAVQAKMTKRAAAFHDPE
ncbi:MAG: crotonase/enoyl-CoA hydratase family protein [Deltaproteobacteria bacterium]|nr:crotonase/enoyl-CoA hydratase family protein [Deltaproteobacteria bacterium]